MWQFDFYYSLAFWGALIVVAGVYRALRRYALIGGVFLLISNSALLLALPRFSPSHLILVWGAAALSLATSRALLGQDRENSPKRRLWLAVLGVVGAVVFLAYFKYQFFRALLGDPLRRSGFLPSDYIALIGVSYFTFKMIHVIVESYKRSIEKPPIVVFLNYITFFPSFISGPISRYPHFAPQFKGDRSASLGPDVGYGLERIIHGLFKKFVLCRICFPYIIINHLDTLHDPSWATLVVGLYAYALYAYFDFSGYTDMAIGAARLMGIELPENFDRPFLRVNIREFWTHWHMSLTTWLVDYIYWPVVRKLRNFQYFRPRPLLLSVIGMNLTFIVCGMWHGESANFILWGAYHGVGISIANTYQRQKKRVKNPRLWKLLNSQSRVGYWASVCLTFHYFVLGGILFVLKPSQLWVLSSGLFH